MSTRIPKDAGTQARRALELAHKYSLIAASLKSQVLFEPQIIIETTAG